MMTGMERVLAALHGNDADRRAFTMTLSLYGARLTGCATAEYYTDPFKYLQGQIAVCDLCRPDIQFSPFTFALEAQAFGSEIAFLDKRPPNVCRLLVRTTDDIALIRVPDIAHDTGLQYLLNATELLVEQLKGSAPVCGVLTSPVDLPAIIMGVENWLELLLFNRSVATQVLHLTCDYFISMANQFFSRGASFIALAMVFNNPKILPLTMVSEFIVPTLSSVFSQIKGPIVYHHGSLPLTGYLPLFDKLPKVAGFVCDHRDNLDEARAAVGDDRLLLGNLDGPTLDKISLPLAIRKAKAILDSRRKDRRFIFATAGADVPWNTPPETLTALRDLMEKATTDDSP